MSKTVEILIYEGMNEFDFAAVYEMLHSVEVMRPAGRVPERGFAVMTVADKLVPIETAHRLYLTAQKSLSSTLNADILIIPGGPGARRPIVPPGVLDWLSRNQSAAELICSISTGVYILGRAGLINDRRVVTHKGFQDDLRKVFPRAKIVQGKRLTIDGGNLLTASGGSAAVDLSLAIIERYYGGSIAQYAATRLEVPYHSVG